MATSGTLGTLSGSWGSTYRITWALLSQSVANNTSTIRLTATFSTTNTTKIASTYSTFVLDGTTVYSGAYSKSGAGTIFSKTKDITVSHNADGTFPGRSVSFSTNDYIMGNKSGSGTISGVTTIPRASSFSLSGSALGSAVTVSISRASNSFTHKVEYAIGNSGYTTVDSSAATTASFTPLTATYASQNTTGTSVTCTVRVTTLNGGTQIGSSTKSISLSIPSSVIPTFSGLSFTRIDNGVPSSWCVYVQGYSKVTAAITGASGIYGSSISGYYISGAGKTSNSSSLTSDILTGEGTYSFSAYVKDSRGRQSVTKTGSITVYPYSPPSLSVSAQRCTSDGKINSSGTYLKFTCTYSCSDVAGKNSIVSKSVSCNGASNTTFASGVEDILDANCAIGRSYTLTATVKDGLGNTATVTFTIPTAERVMNVRSNGKGIAFGKFSETDNLLESEWAIQANKGYKIIDDMNGSQANTIRSSTDPLSFRVFDVYNSTGMPTSYGNLFEMVGRHQHWQAQLLITSDPDLFIRNKGYNSNSFTNWQKAIMGETSTKIKMTTYQGFDGFGSVNGNYIRTPVNGIIPNTETSGGNVGTGSWPFANLYINSFGIIGNYRFGSTWIGKYPSYSNAYGNSNRTWWIGDNGTNHFYINAKEDIVFSKVPQIGNAGNGGYPLIQSTVNRSSPARIDRIQQVSGNKNYMEIMTPNRSTGAWGVDIWASDKRLKKNIANTEVNALEIIKKIRHASFDWVETGNHEQIGYIADEVLEIFPDAVFEVGEDKLKQISNTTITPLISKAVQELNEIVEAQQKEINDLKAQVHELKELVLAMKGAES